MEPDYWEQVECLVLEGLELEPRKRARFVASIPDLHLRAEVESLLDAEGSVVESDLTKAVDEAAIGLCEKRDILPGGSRLSHFRLIELIGTGGMSDVYLALDLELDRKVALKLLSASLSADGERVQRFRQEARAASALSHPNILTIFEIGNVDGQAFIATEYVEGEVLSQRLSRGRMTVPESLDVAAQIAAALAAAHQNGVIHRDIKPGNVMLRPDGLVKVLDFGLARLSRPDGDILPAAELTLPGTVLGTPSYMSPEQARGHPVDHRTDLWSLGALLYGMVTGRAAFPGENIPDILVSVLEKQPPRPSGECSDVPPELDDLILKLLAKDPARRFSSADEVLTALQSLRQPSANAQPSRKGRVIAAGLVAVSAVFFLWWAGQRYGQKNEPRLRPFTTTILENRVTSAAVTADGRTLAWAERDGPLVLRSVKSGEKRTLGLPPDLIVDRISWNSDATTLLLSGHSPASLRWSLWTLAASGGAPRLLRSNARSGAFSPDGTLIAFANSAESEIWVLPASGGEARKVLAGSGTDIFPLLFWSPSGQRLSYQRRRYAPQEGSPSDPDEVERDYQRSYGLIDVRSGKLVFEEPNIRMVSACHLTDGRLLFVDRLPLASSNVWEVGTDLRTGRFTGRPRQRTHQTDPSFMSISCSANGTFVGVTRQLSHSAVYVGDLEQPGPRLTNVRILTLDETSQYPQAWTADSKAVIFEKLNTDERHPVRHWDLYLQDITQRIAQPLITSPRTEYAPALSPDGAWMLYSAYEESRGRSSQTLMASSVQGENPAAIPNVGSFNEFRCAGPGGRRCVIRTIENRQYIYSELDPVQGRGRELARTALGSTAIGHWSLSSDGSKVAFPRASEQAGIHVLNLNSASDGPQEWDIPVPGLAGVGALRWAADDRGWFGAATLGTGMSLVYIDARGRFQTLRESPIVTWGVPSPDGRHLAFADQHMLSNVWRLEGL